MRDSGEVAEWLKAHAWNACIWGTISRVRIPLSPPSAEFAGAVGDIKLSNLFILVCLSWRFCIFLSEVGGCFTDGGLSGEI